MPATQPPAFHECLVVSRIVLWLMLQCSACLHISDSWEAQDLASCIFSSRYLEQWCPQIKEVVQGWLLSQLLLLRTQRGLNQLPKPRSLALPASCWCPFHGTLRFLSWGSLRLSWGRRSCNSAMSLEEFNDGMGQAEWWEGWCREETWR